MKFSEALAQFESIVLNDSSVFTAEEYAGITALRLKEYDKALFWFEKLENHKGLYSNPALIYEALTMMNRNLPGDAAKVKQLLQKIISDDLEGKEFAQEWLKKM